MTEGQDKGEPEPKNLDGKPTIKELYDRYREIEGKAFSEYLSKKGFAWNEYRRIQDGAMKQFLTELEAITKKVE